jgi:integrase
MNGWIVERRSRPPSVWRICLDLGPASPPAKGRRQQWITFHGTKSQAEQKIRGLRTDFDRGELIEPSKRTVGAWLQEWVEKAVKPRRSPRTYETYKNAVQTHLVTSVLGGIRLQQLTPRDIEAYHHEKAHLAPATRKVHHAVLSSALKLAFRDGLVRRNVATLVTDRPTEPQAQECVNVWTAEEASRVLAAAKQHSLQTGAFFALALDSGARKGELQGLRWTDVDLTSGALRIERQLLERLDGNDGAPAFGPTKTRKTRAIDLCPQTLALLREHKREQAELKLANRLHYTDYGLIFAQNWEHRRGSVAALGAPLRSGAIAGVMDKIVKDVNVRRITVHGLRHTSATLLLAAGVQPHVVQRRLGHSNIGTTLNLYAHVLPAMQQDAAQRLAGMLYR